MLKKSLGYLFYVLFLLLMIFAINDMIQIIHLFDKPRLAEIELNHMYIA